MLVIANGVASWLKIPASCRTQDVALRVVDLADEADPAGMRRREPPELAEEIVIGGLNARLGEALRAMLALALLDIEADVVDPLGDVEVEHLLAAPRGFPWSAPR